MLASISLLWDVDESDPSHVSREKDRVLEAQTAECMCIAAPVACQSRVCWHKSCCLEGR